jgi:hypothetical protein
VRATCPSDPGRSGSSTLNRNNMCVSVPAARFDDVA